jgi:hypothetical protein
MTLPPSWSLPDSVRKRVSPTTFGRQRAIAEEGHLVLLLHRPPKAEDISREGVAFWRNLEGEWQMSRGGAGTGGLKKLVADYAAEELRLAQAYEAGTDSLSLFEVLEAVVPLSRAARNLHAALQAGREAVKNDAFLIEMRDLASDVDRNFEVLHEDVRNAIEFRTAREAEETSRLGREAVRSGHRLHLLAALFLPLTAITSIFGMNLPTGLDAANPLPFWAALLAGVCLGGGMVAWVLAKPKI